MSNIGSVGRVRHVEDFHTDNIGTSAGDGLGWLNTSDTNDTAFARAVAAARGLHVSGITAATDNNLLEFNSDNLRFYAQEGQSAIEILVEFSDITNMAFNFGFNDDVGEASNSLPVELDTTTFTANAGTYVGFVFDTDATNDDMHVIWVNGGTLQTSDSTASVSGKTLRLRGIAPTASQWFWMRVEMQDRGSGNGARCTLMCTDHLGRSASRTYDTTITRSTALCYYFGMENRSASSHTVYIKYPVWELGNV